MGQQNLKTFNGTTEAMNERENRPMWSELRDSPIQDNQSTPTAERQPRVPMELARSNDNRRAQIYDQIAIGATTPSAFMQRICSPHPPNWELLGSVDM